MSPKNFLIASFLVSSAVLATSAGCGDDEESAGAGFSCPKVGDKACPNATAATQVQVDFCKKCETDERAYDACLGERCDSNGNLKQPGPSQCRTESDALLACYQRGSTGGTDGGGSDGGGSKDAGGGG